MTLSLHFECPECRQAVSRSLADLAPLREQNCPSCRVPVRVSAATLRNFRNDLSEYCRPPETSRLTERN